MNFVPLPLTAVALFATLIEPDNVVCDASKGSVESLVRTVSAVNETVELSSVISDMIATCFVLANSKVVTPFDATVPELLDSSVTVSPATKVPFTFDRMNRPAPSLSFSITPVAPEVPPVSVSPTAIVTEPVVATCVNVEILNKPKL